MQATSTPKSLVESFARQLSANKGVNIEQFGANKYNDLSWRLLDLFVYGLTVGQVDLQSGNCSDEQANLQKMNEATHAQYNQTNLAKTPQLKMKFEVDNQTYDMVITRTRPKHGLQMGLKISIGSASVFVGGLDFHDLKEKLENQTTTHSFSKSVKGSLDKPAVLVQGLAESRTVTGVNIITHSKTINGVPAEYATPTIERRDLPSVPGVSIHIGNNFIADANKLKHVDDGATAAYVGDMFVTTVVDGYGRNAKHECSSVHSSIISTAALLTARDYRTRTMTDTDLKKNFLTHIKSLYQSVSMPSGDTGVTFAGGVTYIDNEGNAKLLSVGFSTAMFVSVADDNSIQHYHAQKERSSKPYVSSQEFKDLDKYCTVAVHDVPNNIIGYKLGSDGCFSEYCEDIPGGYDQTQELLNVTCKNLPKHGEISQNFSDEALLAARNNKRGEELENAKKELNQTLLVPRFIAKALPDGAINKLLVQIDKKPDDFWNALKGLSEDELPGSLKMPAATAVTQIEIELKIVNSPEVSQWDAKAKLSDFIQVVTDDQGVKSLRLKDDVEMLEGTQLLLDICTIALSRNPGLINVNLIEEGKVTVGRVVDLAKSRINDVIANWKMFIHEPKDSDTEWRTLATDAGRNQYQPSFGKPSDETVNAWRVNWEQAAITYNKASVNIKKWAGDDIVFVSVDKAMMLNELRQRKDQL